MRDWLSSQEELPINRICNSSCLLVINGIVKRIIIQLDEETLSQLDEAAGEGSESRAGFVRHAIQLALAERRRRRELDRIVESFTTVPPEDLTPAKAAVRKAWPG